MDIIEGISHPQYNMEKYNLLRLYFVEKFHSNEYSLLRLNIYQDVKHPGRNIIKYYEVEEIILYLSPNILNRKYWGKQYELSDILEAKKEIEFLLLTDKSEFSINYLRNIQKSRLKI